MATLKEMTDWARAAKASGEIIDFDSDVSGISFETDQGWCPWIYTTEYEEDDASIWRIDPRSD